MASLVLGVFAFLTTLAAIAWVLLRAFDVHDTCKKYLPGFIILIVSTVLALLAAVVFIAVIKKVEADNPNDVSTSQTTLELEVEKLKPDYAWYLVLLAVVFNIIAAVLLFLDRKESAYQNMGDRTSLNGDTYQ